LTSAAVTGTTTKTLTLNEQGGGTITATWSDYDTAPVTSVFGRTGAITAQSGDYTTLLVTENTNLYYTDARSRAAFSESVIGLDYNSTTGILSTTTGYGIPTTASQATWDTAYNDKINSAAVTGLATKTLTLTQQDGGTVTASWTDSDATNLITEVYNKTGATLTKGTVVYISGSQGNLPAVSKALATSDATSAQTYGVVREDITNMNNGYVVVIGNLENIDTQAYPDGTQLYLSGTTAGTWTSTKPYAPIHLVYVGIVVRSHPTQGVVEIKIQNGYELDELHNVSAQNPTNGNILQYVTSTGLWTAVAGTTTNIAEGTNLYYTQARFDSAFAAKTTTNLTEGTNLYFTNTRARAAISETVTGLDYNNTTGVFSTTTGYGIPTTASQTNWDTAYTNRITSASAPLSIASNAISISQANTTTNGFLSSTDWNTFNNKQAAGNYITSLTGEATASGPGSASVTLTNSAVIGKVLTGLNVTGGSVNATDSILSAFGKVQNQINGLIGGSIYQGVWNATTNTPTLTSSVGTKGYYYIVNVAGSTNLNGITDWQVGDWAIYDGTAWQKVDNTDAVSSVNGFTGAVSLTTDNISEGSTNLYFTNTRAQNAITLTTTGTSGAATYTSGTLNIPQYQAVLTNPVTGTGTTNTLPKFTGTSAIGNSNITDTGSLITLGSNTTISNGALGIGTSSLTNSNLAFGKTITGAVTSYGIFGTSIVGADVTTSARYYATSVSTAASAFTLIDLVHFYSGQGSFGAGSTVTNQYGFFVQSSLQSATNNFGFYGNIASGTNRWNLYMNGTANNYMAGSLGIGSTSLTGYSLRVSKNLTGSVNYWGIASEGTVQSDVTAQARGFSTSIGTAASAFTLSNLYHYIATQATIGSTSSVSTQIGFFVENSLTGATNNYGFRGNLASASNTYNLFMDGSAPNYFAGGLSIGTSNIGATNLLVAKNITGNVTGIAMRESGVIQSDVTSSARLLNLLSSTAAATFTLPSLYQIYIEQGTFGAGSTVTNQFGIYIDSSMNGATNNYAFYSGIGSGTNRWNLYMAGTAANYMAGNTGIGTTTTNSFLNIGAGTTAKAQINLATSVAPTTPNDGDIWFDGTAIKVRVGGVTRTIAVV
jgi:hypothetical protein